RFGLTAASILFGCQPPRARLICRPMAQIFDFAPVQIEHGRAKITPEGYFVADALVGRANNIQEYRAADLGDAFADRDPNSIVRIFRPESEVFATDSLATASRLPITLDHPVQNG